MPVGCVRVGTMKMLHVGFLCFVVLDAQIDNGIDTLIVTGLIGIMCFDLVTIILANNIVLCTFVTL